MPADDSTSEAAQDTLQSASKNNNYSLADEYARRKDVCGPFCDNEPEVSFVDEWGIEVHWCRDCYEKDCSHCREPIEDDQNKRKGLCQGCRVEIQMWSGDDDRGIEKEPDSQQTTLITDGGIEQSSRADKLTDSDTGTAPDSDSIELSGRSVFPYPGNKAKHAEWIISLFPEHECYVEAFGGAAGVLANKPESKVEVYNDRDGDLTQFFDVLREQGNELVNWLRDVPYSREKYDQWSPRWYSGWRPEDPVKRAGIFFFLRATAFGGKYRYQGGFKISPTRNQAMTYQNQVKRLRAFADRFRDQVVIENRNWEYIIDHWDGPGTLFYFDPPYANTTIRYRHGKDFDHEEFAAALAETEGRWVVSYSEPPECIREVGKTVISKETKHLMAAGHNGSADETTEQLVLNYDPDAIDPFVEKQVPLDSF